MQGNCGGELVEGKYISNSLWNDLLLVKYSEFGYNDACISSGTEGVATSNYGRNLMKEMMLVYDGDQHRYAQIAGHGFRILAEAMEKDLPYEIKCPSLLICGTKDRAGSCIRYNRAWHQKTKIPLKWIEGAGHNSNTDKPEMINSLLEEFFSNIL